MALPHSEESERAVLRALLLDLVAALPEGAIELGFLQGHSSVAPSDFVSVIIAHGGPSGRRHPRPVGRPETPCTSIVNEQKPPLFPPS